MVVKIGVYICHCGENIAHNVDVEKVAEAIGGLDGVAIVRHYLYTCSEQGQKMIKDDIKGLDLNRVVVASCSPRMHEITFRAACREAGLNPYLYTHANIREHCSWVHKDKDAATGKAIDLITAAVRRVALQEPLVAKEVPVNPNTLVVGGGIAGISAALKIAASGNQVYLVEKLPSVGGHMSQLDVTFPTLDCSECIMTPKMTEVGANPFVKLLTCSEVESVSGYVGNFKVKIRKRARFVTEKCTACGDCTKGCPVETLSEFNQGLAKRKAIYLPFAQAVPNKYVIDKKETPPCKLACPIHMDIQGYLALVAAGKLEEAYQLLRRTNPLPAICGRVCYHPCEDACKRGYLDEPLAINAIKRFISGEVDVEKIGIPEIIKNGKTVAVVGSGPAGLAAAHDLVLLGYEATVFEALPEAGGMLRVGIPAYRLPREVLDKEIAYIEKLGVAIQTNTVVGGDVMLNDLRHAYDAVFIATGSPESLKLGIPGEDNVGVIPGIDFLGAVNRGAKIHIGSRVVVIGGGNTAIDAARTARRMGSAVKVIYRRSRTEMPANEAETRAAEEEGVEFVFLAAPVRVTSQGGKIVGVECVRMELGEPDESGRRKPVPVAGSEFHIAADTVIPALGQRARLDFTSGVPLEVSRDRLAVNEMTLSTSVQGVFGGGDVVTGPAKVVDAISAGKKAAKSIHSYLAGEPLEPQFDKSPVPPDEKEVAELRKLYPTGKRLAAPELSPEKRTSDFSEVEGCYDVEQAREEALRCLACGGCCDCRECEKLCEAQAIDHSMKDEVVEVEVGSILVATGYGLFDPTAIAQYGYGRYDNVITALEFERLASAGGPTGGEILLKNGKKPESVAIIHCVGSRDQNYHEYCSRVCCMYGLKDAYLVKEKTGAQVYEMYIDMRCFGEGYEEFYKRLSEEGIEFIRGKPTEVTNRALADEEKGKLVVVTEDTLLGAMLRVPVDMVVLCPAMEPQGDAEKIARLFNIGRRTDGFFQERHLKLDPVATPTSGVFVVGCCQSPKDISDTVSHAMAGASEALALVGKGTITLGVEVASVDESICIGCGRCEAICEFHAIELMSEERAVPLSRVNEVICQGCGACAVICPTGAMSIRNFTRQQISSMVETLTGSAK